MGVADHAIASPDAQQVPVVAGVERNIVASAQASCEVDEIAQRKVGEVEQVAEAEARVLEVDAEIADIRREIGIIWQVGGDVGIGLLRVHAHEADRRHLLRFQRGKSRHQSRCQQPYFQSFHIRMFFFFSPSFPFASRVSHNAVRASKD